MAFSYSRCRAFCVFAFAITSLLGFVPHASADPARVANSSLALPDDLPGGDYGTAAAFPSLSGFDRPVGFAVPPGETNRLFVIEQPGILSVIPDLSSPSPTREVFLDIRSDVRIGTTTAATFISARMAISTSRPATKEEPTTPATTPSTLTGIFLAAFSVSTWISIRRTSFRIPTPRSTREPIASPRTIPSSGRPPSMAPR